MSGESIPEFCPVCGDKIVVIDSDGWAICPRCSAEEIRKSEWREKRLAILGIVFSGAGFAIGILSGNTLVTTIMALFTVGSIWMLWGELKN